MNVYVFFNDNWHNEHKQQQSLEERSNINTDLAEFQSRLVRLLSSDSLVKSGLSTTKGTQKIMDIVN